MKFEININKEIEAEDAAEAIEKFWDEVETTDLEIIARED